MKRHVKLEIAEFLAEMDFFMAMQEKDYVVLVPLYEERAEVEVEIFNIDTFDIERLKKIQESIELGDQVVVKISDNVEEPFLYARAIDAIYGIILTHDFQVRKTYPPRIELDSVPEEYAKQIEALVILKAEFDELLRNLDVGSALTDVAMNDMAVFNYTMPNILPLSLCYLSHPEGDELAEYDPFLNFNHLSTGRLGVRRLRKVFAEYLEEQIFYPIQYKEVDICADLFEGVLSNMEVFLDDEVNEVLKRLVRSFRDEPGVQYS